MAIDLLGPANASGAVTTRPGETRAFSATDTWIADCTSVAADDGTLLQAAFLNGILAQLRQAIRQAGVTEDNADDQMLWKAMQAAALSTGGKLPAAYVGGLEVTTPTTTTITVAAGAARSDDNTVDLVLASAMTKSFSAWAIGTGNGGLDTGAVANSTWYHVYLIRRVSDGLIDVLISASGTAPTIPSGWAGARLIMSVYNTSGGTLRPFRQIGDMVSWNPMLNTAVAGTSSSAIFNTTRQLITVDVPPLVNMRAWISAGAASQGIDNNVTIADPASTDYALSAVSFPTTYPFWSIQPAQAPAGAYPVTVHDLVATDSSGRVATRAAAVPNVSWLQTIGFQHPRRR